MSLKNSGQQGFLRQLKSILGKRTRLKSSRRQMVVEDLEPRIVLSNIGYYDMGIGQGDPSQVTAILAAGHTPVQIFNLSAFELAFIDVLDVQNSDNAVYGAEYVSRLNTISNAVNAGMGLVIHDRFVDGAESILPGGAGFNIIRDFTNDLDIDVLDNTTLVTNGPGGIVDNTTLDNGTSSSHGFAFAGSLPGTSRLILSTTDPTHIVTFSYRFGSGIVVYSSIPLDFYRSGGTPAAFSQIYAPNVLAYAAASAVPLTLTVTPGVIAENDGLAASTGTVARPRGSDLSVPLSVTLTSSDTSEAMVQGIVTIPIGSLSASFDIDAVDDDLLDGTQTAVITASIVGYSTSANLSVLDHEVLTMTVDPVGFFENAGANAATMTITRNNTDIDPPNKIVSVGNELRRYDAAGVLVSSVPIPWPAGPRPAGQDAHDVVAMDNGNIAVYNGTTTAFLSVLNAGTGVWRHIPLSGVSTAPADNGTGGITTTGNYVFLTDMETSAGNPFGLVRVNVITNAVTRFGTNSFGRRLFMNTPFDTSIYEINPVDGTVMKVIPLPVGNAGGAGLAFDGTYVWYIPGNTNTLLKINPDTSTVVETIQLNFNLTPRDIQGLAWLRGKVYMADANRDDILVFDPVLKNFTSIIDEDVVAGITLGNGLAGSPASDPLNDSLFVTGRVGFGNYEVFKINAATGQIEARFPGDSADSGLAVVGNELYVGSQSTGQFRVYSLPSLTQLPNVSLPPGVLFSQTFGIGSDGVPGLVPTSFRYRDTTVGLDGKLYALDVNGIDVGVFDPNTLAALNFFKLEEAVRAISVAADGTIYGGDGLGFVIEFNSLGKTVRKVGSAMGAIDDIDLNNADKILLSDSSGMFTATDRTLTTPFSVVDTSSASDAFISFGESAFFSKADLVVTITNPDTTEVSVPRTVIIPAGQKSITVPVDAVDDAIRDGAQQVLLSVSAAGYIGASQTVIVLDAEGINVDVIANTISEASGANATKVKVSRSDFLGPFGHVSTQAFSNNTAFDIPDNGKILVPIVVPSQNSIVRDINVTVNFEHQWLPDLDVFLVSPQGTRVELFTDLVSNGNGLTGTILDDQAFVSILSGSAPYTGSFRPEGLLSTFNTEPASGTWFLEVNDDNTSDLGRLLGWSMTMETAGLSEVSVILQSSDVNKASFQGSATKQVTIPANQSEVIVDLDAVDNNLLDGDKTVTIRAIASDLAEFSLGMDNVVVTDSERMTFSVNRSSVSEAAGPGALTGTLTRLNDNIAATFRVFLSSSNTGKLTVPAFVDILPNQRIATFPINAIDNTIIDGDTLVTITANAPGYLSIPAVDINVLDLEPVLSLTTLTPTVSENNGTLSVTVTRHDQSPAQLASALTVNLTATAGLSVSSPVVIPANSVSHTFSVNIVDNAKLDGPRTATITATGTGIQAGSLVISITDHETLTVTVDKSSFLENAGINAAVGTVRRSNTENMGQALVVTLASSDLTELTVPATVTIPANQVSATFFIAAVNDPDLDGPQDVTIRATAAAFVDGTAVVTVLDHEPPIITSPASTTISPRPVVTWNAITGALRYDVWVSNLSSGVSQLLRDTNVTTNSYTPPENLGIGRYRVWARAIDSLEEAGYWSAGHDFTINTAPTITAPVASGTTADSAFRTITWTAVTDATKYELWVNNITTGQVLVINRTGAAALNTTSYVSTEGLGSGSYKIWARGKNLSGEFGLWSAPVTHVVLAPPVINQPTSGGTFDRTPTFSWNPIAGATSYDVWIGDTKANTVTFRDQAVKTTSFTATRDMANGEYRVWVRAQSGDVFSVWSQSRTFSVGLPPKITSATTVGANNATPKFTWTSISEVETYELWVNNSAGQRVIHFTNLTTTTFTSATDLPAGTYRAWVRAVSKMGEISAWSSPVDLTIVATEHLEPSQPFVESAVLASLVFDDGPLTPEESETTFAADVETLSEAPSEPEFALELPALNGLAATPVGSDSPVSPATAEFDEVMAEWQSAEWWAENPVQDHRAIDTASALAAGLGIFVRTGHTADKRRKKNLN